jgi:hypothetical protein
MFIIFMPFVMQPTFAYVEGEVLYSEDAIVYNQLYYEIFDSLGEAGRDSLVFLKMFNVTAGDGVSIEISYNNDSVRVERFVFYKIEEDMIFRKLSTDIVPNLYNQIVEIDGNGVYGLALFCTRISDVESISFTITVMVVTI